jgi:hypothetical protein
MRKAMQPATESTVLGDFNDVSFSYAGITSTFFRRDGKFMVRTDGPDGTLAGLRNRLHLRRVSLAAVPDRLPRWPLSGAGHRLGQPAQGAGRTALVSPLSRPEPDRIKTLCTGPACSRTGTTCAPSAIPRICARITTPKLNRFNTTWSEINVVLRSLPRSRRRSSRLGQEGRGLAKAEPHQGAGHRPRRTARPAISVARDGHERAGSGDRQPLEPQAQCPVDGGHARRPRSAPLQRSASRPAANWSCAPAAIRGAGRFWEDYSFWPTVAGHPPAGVADALISTTPTGR